MDSIYPNSTVTWTDKVNDVDDVDASHINQAYAEIIAMENDIPTVKSRVSSTELELGINQPIVEMFDFSGQTEGTTSHYTGYNGYDFTVSNNTVVTSIKHQVGISSASKIGIWNVNTQTKLYEWDFTPTGVWSTFDLLTPITLQAGITYFIGCYYTSTTTLIWRYMNQTNPVTSPNGAVWMRGRTPNDNSSSDIFPTSTYNDMCYARLIPVIGAIKLTTKVDNLENEISTLQGENSNATTIQGKSIPAPTSTDDGKAIKYNNTTGAFEYGTVSSTTSYNDLTDKPTLSTVATTGSYADLNNKPTVKIGTGTIPITGWVANSGDYTYKLDVAITGILSTDVVGIIIDNDSQDIASACQLCASIDSYDGGITIYSKSVPTNVISYSYNTLVSNSTYSSPTEEDWHTSTLLNGWVNYNADYFQSAGYYKDSTGIVHLKGLIKDGTSSGNAVIFNLPVGYRPNRSLVFSSICCASNGSTFAIVVLEINASGDLYFGSIIPYNTWVTLDGLSFRAEQ